MVPEEGQLWDDKSPMLVVIYRCIHHHASLGAILWSDSNHASGMRRIAMQRHEDQGALLGPPTVVPRRSHLSHYCPPLT